MDLPYDFSAPVVVDLTSHEFTSSWAKDEPPTKEAVKEQPWEKFYEQVTKPMAFGEAGTTTAADLSEEDAAFEAFAEQSGLNDLTGRTPATGATADLSQGSEQVETSGTVDAGEEAMWNAFVEQSGSGWIFGEAGAAADMTERVQADKQAESMREQVAQDELHESLRRQSHEDHYGEGSDLSDDEAWDAYQSSLGQS